MTKERFGKVPESILADTRLGLRDIRLLLALYVHANKHGECNPSRVLLSKLTGYPESRISEITSRLVGLGWLEKEGGVYKLKIGHDPDEATKRAKSLHARKRRAEFNKSRSYLVLALLEAGRPYKCSLDGCTDMDLTLDHVVPLSRGGTDDLGNLRFLCFRHNTQKGDREGQ